ncbi:MAG: MFS transporter [Candidatus Lokiarchaeota archaeon]|nr:MFS transporter [Candidatus Lokiarchaeota archaeon]
MQSRLKKLKKQSVPPSHKFTSDFDSVIFIVVWNSLGFFFVDFILVYMISQVWEGTGLAIGLYPAFLTSGGLIGSLFVGYLTDHVSKQKLVMLGSFGRGLSYFSLYFSIILQSLAGIYISSFLLGLGAQLFWVPLDTLISEKSSKHHRSSAFGRRRFALGIGQVIGAIVGLTIFGLANFFTPNSTFLIYIAIPIFGLANFYAGIRFFLSVDEDKKFQYSNKSTEEIEVLSEEKIDDKTSPEKPLRLYIFGLILLFFALFLGSINVGIYRPFILPIVFENMNEPATVISWFYLPATVVGTLIAPKLGVIADKINPYITITITSIIGGIITWIIVFLTTDLWIFAILLIFDNTIMLTSGFVFINFLSRISEKHRGKIFGLITSFDSLGLIIGPILGGLVYDISYTTPFIISILVEWALIPFFVLGMWILNPQIVETLGDKKKQ